MKGEAIVSRRQGLNSKHHRKCRSNGGGGGKNLVEVDRENHEAWHKLFSNFEPWRIAAIINATWIDPDYKFVVVRRSR